MTDAAQMDRACGVLLGAACGDALGAGYEFGCAPLAPDEEPRMIGGGLGGFAPGEWTDDTAQAVAIARVAATGADLRTEAALDQVAAGFLEWFAGSPPDVGIQTRAVLSAVGPAGGPGLAARMRDAAAAVHERTGRSGGNGSLMRTAPVALAHLDDAGALVEAAMAVSALTHHDPQAGEACALWCLAIRHAVLTGEVAVRPGLRHLPEPAQAFWAARLDEADQREPGSFTPNGWVVTALQAAWSAITHPGGRAANEASGRRDHGRDHPCLHLQHALHAAVHIGDDTDTVAAIAGALLGARWGVSAIPATWREVVHGWPGLRAGDLVELAALTVLGGQPGAYGWPGCERIDYSWQHGHDALARHPHDDGVWLSGASALETLPADVTAVVTLCLLGSAAVPAHLRHLTFRLLDTTDEDNPNLDFVIDDAARTVARLRDEGETVLLHCVAAHSRTPTVAARYAVLRGVPLEQALSEVVAALPAARPNSALVAALRRLVG